MIVVPSSIQAELIEHARTGAPREVCGVLGGTFDHDRSRVAAYVPATNAADRPRERYRIDPTELLSILEDFDTRGHRVVGFYHSHPRGPPAPSETDAAGAAWPNRSYVIGVPEASTILRSWRWRPDGDGFERERILRSAESDDDTFSESDGKPW